MRFLDSKIVWIQLRQAFIMNAVIYIQCPSSLIDRFSCDFSVESLKNTSLRENNGIDPSSINKQPRKKGVRVGFSIPICLCSAF